MCAVGVARARARHISSQSLFAEQMSMAHARVPCAVRTLFIHRLFTVLCTEAPETPCAMWSCIILYIKYVCRVFLDIALEVPRAQALSLGSKELVRACERCVLRKIVHTRAHNIGRALNHMWL